MTEELLDATMTCPHKAAMMAAGWDQRGIEVGKLTRRHIDQAVNAVLSNPSRFDDTCDDPLPMAVTAFETEVARRPYLGLPIEADPYKVYEGQLALLRAALYAVKTAFGTFTVPDDAIAVIRSHGTWTAQQANDLQFNLHLQGMMVQANTISVHRNPLTEATRVLYQPLVLGHRGPEGQDSPLTRSWYNPATGHVCWAHDWTDDAGSHRLGNAWKKTYSLPEHVGPWVTEKLRMCQPQAGDPFAVIFPPAVEVRYNPALAEEWSRAEQRAKGYGANYEGVRASATNVTGTEPKHWNQCATPGDRCPFISPCWNGDDSKLVKIKDLLR